MRSHIRVAIVFATALIAGVGCSNGKLTRPEAKTKLDDWYGVNFPSGHVEILLVGGTVSDTCISSYVSPRPVSDEDFYKFYTRLGLVTIQPEHATVATVSLTDTAKKAATSGPYGHTVKKNCDTWQYTLPLSEFTGTEVTGIQQEGTHAKVEYKACKKLTPIGKAVRDLHLSDQEIRYNPIIGLDRLLERVGDRDSYCEYENALFAKYDDGWRVE